MEQALAEQSVPHSIIRGAYYMSNWDGYLDAVRQSGELATFYPVDFRLPMVAPQDIGQLAARLLTAPTVERGPHFAEGPARYCPADVAAAFSAALDQPVRAVQLPRAQWPATLRGMGFSEAATESFVAMTDLTLQGDFPRPEATERGHTTLQAYVQALVQRAAR
ncbi:hypothetical protein [Hymenobacter gummosus]|uniref:hypothetical protein n=1 Tax=Hymenobacter gummosus TaxID=1776032 RepID=UPI001A9F2D82|nr:hypothetical protein [Hymenobacter gummosus]